MAFGTVEFRVDDNLVPEFQSLFFWNGLWDLR